MQPDTFQTTNLRATVYQPPMCTWGMVINLPSRYLIGWFVMLMIAGTLLSFPPNKGTANWKPVATDGTAAVETQVPVVVLSLCWMH